MIFFYAFEVYNFQNWRNSIFTDSEIDLFMFWLICEFFSEKQLTYSEIDGFEFSGFWFPDLWMTDFNWRIRRSPQTETWKGCDQGAQPLNTKSDIEYNSEIMSEGRMLLLTYKSLLKINEDIFNILLKFIQ